MRSRVREFMVPLVVGAPISVVSMIMVVMATSGLRTVGLLAGILVAQLAWFGIRSLPLPAFALVCVAFALQAASSGLFLTLPSAVVFPIAVYGVCARGRPTSVPAAVIGGVAGAGVAAWRFSVDRALAAAGVEPSPVAVSIALVAVVAAAASLGLLRRTQLTNLALLAERARRADADRTAGQVRAIRDERQRIAREMHDVVSHSLSVIVALARGGQFVTADADRSAEILVTIEDTGRQALTDMRGLVGVLRPDADGQTDDTDSPRTAVEGPQPDLRQLPALIERTRAAGLIVELTVTGTPRALSPAAELAAFRVVQEALTNVVKHAPSAPAVTVGVAWVPAGVVLRIHNDAATGATAGGNGDRRKSSGGYGLIAMRERVVAVGGSVCAAAQSGGGFTVVAEIPGPTSSTERNSQ